MIRPRDHPVARQFLAMSQPPPERDPMSDERFARLEARLARIEEHLGLDGGTESVDEIAPHARRTEEELEFEVGQHWFAVAGVMALTVGAAFLLSLPFAGLPAIIPSTVGYIVVGGLFLLAHAWQRSFALVASYIRGAAMALLFAATMRLCFPLQRHVLAIGSWPAQALLIGVVTLNLWLALSRRSGWLVGVALATGGITVTVLESPALSLGLLLLLAFTAMFVTERENWRALSLVSVAGAHSAYVGWMLGPLLRGSVLHFESTLPFAPLAVLGVMAVLAAGRWRRVTGEPEGVWDTMHALGNCIFGYGVFLVHTLAVFPALIVPLHSIAFAGLLGVAAVFWVRRQSQIATFFYAMTAYAALSVAILKLAAAPAVFVWLSVQSVVVVATAIWFRSRFIVVANFLIYLAIVLGYVVTAENETGISIGFGLVALVSARILNWQKSRLELKTEMMRNAYLLSAFIVFPYALYHLVPLKYVGLAWIGLALAYYALNALIQNQKYRWMGHATLLLTACYLVIVATRQFEPVYRVLSFLALGTVLIGVSLLFTRSRRRTTER
jgi:hypothetical protein